MTPRAANQETPHHTRELLLTQILQTPNSDMLPQAMDTAIAPEFQPANRPLRTSLQSVDARRKYATVLHR